MYLFATWSFCNEVNGTSEALPNVAKLKWANPYAADLHDISDIHLTTTKAVGTKSADQYNGDLLSQLLQQFQSMLVLATYKVQVVPQSEGLRKHEGGKFMLLR